METPRLLPKAIFLASFAFTGCHKGYDDRVDIFKPIDEPRPNVLNAQECINKEMDAQYNDHAGFNSILRVPAPSVNYVYNVTACLSNKVFPGYFCSSYGDWTDLDSWTCQKTYE